MKDGTTGLHNGSAALSYLVNLVLLSKSTDVFSGHPVRLK